MATTAKSRTADLTGDKLSEYIRDLVLRYNSVAALNLASSRVVWSTDLVLKEYQNATNYDEEYQHMCKEMNELALKKVQACDKWLLATKKEIDRLMDRSEKEYRNVSH